MQPKYGLDEQNQKQKTRKERTNTRDIHVAMMSSDVAISPVETTAGDIWNTIATTHEGQYTGSYNDLRFSRFTQTYTCALLSEE